MKKFFAWLDRTFIKPVEDSKMPIGVFILMAVGYIALRNLMEGSFESLHLLGLSPITLHGIEELFLHLNFAWLFVFMAGIILIHFVTGYDIRKIARVLLTYSFIVVLPPIIDVMFNPGGYYLLYPTNIETVVTGFKALYRPWLFFKEWHGGAIPYGSTPGMIIEGYLGIILVAVYSGMRAKGTVRKVVAVIGAPLVIGAALAFAGVAGISQVLVSMWIPHDPVTGTTIYFTGGLLSSATRKYAIVLLFSFVPVLWLGLWLYNKMKTRLLMKALDPFMLILTAVAMGAGFLFAWLGLKDILTGVPRNPFDYLALVGFLVLGLLTASLKIFAGKAADHSLDTKDRKTFKRGATGMLVLAGGYVWALGYSPLFVWIAGMALMLIIELPPVRLKRFLIPSAISNALFILIMVICGYSIFTTSRTMSVFPWQIAVAVFGVMTLTFLGRDLIRRSLTKSPRTSGEAVQKKES